VITQNENISKPQCLLRSISVYKPGSAQQTISIGTIRIELWKRKKAQALVSQTHRSVRGQTTSTIAEGSNYLRILIFVAENQRFINIPLHKGENHITRLEGNDGQSAAMLVVPNKDNGHHNFGVSDVQAPPTAPPPSLPLSLQAFEAIEKEKVKQIDINFHSRDDMVLFQNLIKDYSRRLWKEPSLR